jgi:hypothetical protein
MAFQDLPAGAAVFIDAGTIDRVPGLTRYAPA